MIVVFATNHDGATRSSHWIALRTHERLATEVKIRLTLLEGHGATRQELERTMTSEVEGLAFFGHGTPHGLYANGMTVLDSQNLSIVRGSWVHAFACRAGIELAAQATAAGAICFVGYQCGLLIEWEPEDIPEPIIDDFIHFVTETTVGLSRGVYDKHALCASVMDSQARIMEWCDANPERR